MPKIRITMIDSTQNMYGGRSMDTLTRLKQLMKQKKMSTYKLAQEAGFH
ncbi:hypothetical protein L0P06_09695 [Amedibacillus dolichus]|nr:hypothetical protein [Amedibacillus dolichus]MCG4880338.1 hypothetical protein [Amedibacillus dolichus]